MGREQRALSAGSKPEGLSRRRRALFAATGVALSVAATLVAGELALRIKHGGLLGRPPSAAVMLQPGSGSYPAVHDPELGYVPRPHTSGRDNVWNREVTIDADGIRGNGAPRLEGRPLLAVGDSFTFGDEVDDADTWPAQLEQLLGRPVLNGGVFGYGFDQVALRAERLLDGPAADADTLIVSVLPDDVRRCEFSYRYAWKPWFEVEDGALVPRGVPVPRPHRGPAREALWRRVLRASFVGDRAMRLIDPEGWALPDSVQVHDRGKAVARLLLERLLARTHAEGRRLLLVIQWSPSESPEWTRELIAHARLLGVAVLDLEERISTLVEQRGLMAAFRVEPGPGGATGIGHLNRRGNGEVARAIADAL